MDSLAQALEAPELDHAALYSFALMFCRRLVLILCLFAFALSACQRTPKSEHPALKQLPNTIVWAWERTEDLRWLPGDVGVAYVATSIMLTKNQADVRPRSAPLLVPPNTVTIPIVHVDVSYYHAPVLSEFQRDTVVNQVLRIAEATNASVVQLDFEVRTSQRAFLKEVVTTIRQKLPPHRALSITALASWCAGDYWIADMPADEIVPMAFRMGRDDPSMRQMLEQQPRFPRANCQSATGYALDEPVRINPDGRHYLFSPKAWTQQAWLDILQRLQATSAH